MSVEIKPLKDTKAFEKIKVGPVELGHRIVFPPTTRMRALEDHTPSEMQLRYYDARSKYPGSLLIVEGTFPTAKTGLYDGAPGIYTDRQVAGWKAINEKIHKNGSYSAVQFWGLGRVADPVANKKAGEKLVAPSAIYHDEATKEAAEKIGNPIHALTTEEVENLIKDDYTKAAKNAIAAGFDIIELHMAHGYILDCFLQSSTNKRTDKYGGSIENRARFPLELVDHLTEVVGAERLAIRISPWAKFQAMKAEEDEINPIAQFGYLVSQLENRGKAGKRLAYISLVEPRVEGIFNVDEKDQVGSNDFVKTIWSGTLMRAGNYTYDAPDFTQLKEDLSDNRTIVGFSRYYISNPDLVAKLHDGHALTPYDRNTFYAPSDWGYNSYPAYGAEQGSQEEFEKVLPQAISGLKL